MHDVILISCAIRISLLTKGSNITGNMGIPVQGFRFLFSREYRDPGSLMSQPYFSLFFFLFQWEEREGEKNMSGHSGQLPVPRRKVIIAFMAACHVHGMQIKTCIMLGVTVLCSLYPHWQAIATKCAFRMIPLVHIEKKKESSRERTRSVISPTGRATTEAASSDLRIQE